MAGLKNRNLLSTKFLNAKIRDSGNRFFIVHVKHFIGDYFITTLDNQAYAFKVVGSEIQTYNETAMKPIRIIDYSTKHYRPISDKTDEIKLVLEKNGLGRINMNMWQTFKTLGNREKKDFKPHIIEELIKEIINESKSEMGKILSKEPRYQQAQAQVLDLLKGLETDRIITPVKSIAEYIEDDLIATDSQFFGTVMTTYQRTDIEHKKVTNTAVDAKKPVMIILLAVMMIGLIIAVVYIGIEQGWFDSITGYVDQFAGLGEGISLQPPSQPIAAGSVASKYPTPELAKEAIANGEAKLTDFPPNMRSLLK